MTKRNTTHCVLYHANCYDGLGAAWAIREQLGDAADYIPVQYGEAPPDVTGKHVIIADFSFSPLVLRIMEEKAASLTLLDHHASAKDMLQDYQCLCPGTHIEFDMKRSGAMMAWNHFHPNQEPPLLLQHIQDQDLWNWEMPHSEAFLRNLSSYPMSMQTYDKVANFSSDEYEQFVRQGQGLVAQFKTFVSEFVNRALPVELDGIQGFHVATSHHFRNEVGSALARKRNTFGLLWQVDSNCIKVSLRSVDQCDVKDIAVRFGGGGHPTAASFNLPLERLPELIAGKLQSPLYAASLMDTPRT